MRGPGAMWHGTSASSVETQPARDFTWHGFPTRGSWYSRTLVGTPTNQPGAKRRNIRIPPSTADTGYKPVLRKSRLVSHLFGVPLCHFILPRLLGDITVS